MSWDAFIPLLTLLTSLVPAAIIFFFREERVRARTAVNLGGATLKLALIAVMLWGVFHEQRYEFRLPMLPGLDFVLRAGCARSDVAAGDLGVGDDRLRFDSRAVSRRSEAAAGVFDSQPSFVHRPGGRAAGAFFNGGRRGASGASGLDEDHAVFLRG
jgi:hypothetical protein